MIIIKAPNTKIVIKSIKIIVTITIKVLILSKIAITKVKLLIVTTS